MPLPQFPPRVLPQSPILSSRQEAFCRRFAAAGNAAEAARRAGYAEASARQTGHGLLERPHIIERIRAIRQAWRATARDEAQILLARLEQAWDVAVAAGSAALMLQVIRLQAEVSGFGRGGEARRSELWPLPEEDEFGEDRFGDGPALAAAEPGPLARGVRHGRHRAERARAQHRLKAGARAEAPGADARDYVETLFDLDAAVEERRRLGPLAGAAPECQRPESADTEDPNIGNPEPGVGDMPPYPGGLASPDRGGPDFQKGDDAFTDACEAGWMYDRRGGLMPFDPLAPDDPEGRFALAAGAMQDDPFGATQDAEPRQHDKS